nr:MAG TPA: Protein gmr sensing, diffusible signal factor.19A [Caudoviricetes sp.]
MIQYWVSPLWLLGEVPNIFYPSHHLIGRKPNG